MTADRMREESSTGWPEVAKQCLIAVTVAVTAVLLAVAAAAAVLAGFTAFAVLSGISSLR